MKRLFRNKLWVRSLVQIFFFVLVALISLNHTLAEAGKGIPFLSSASLHSLCPFGGVVSIYQYATVGTFVQKIHESSFVLMILGFLLALLFGPVFCGWVCPLGTFQEWIARLGRKLFKPRRYNHFIPYKVDRWLRFLRYGVLAWVLHDRRHRQADLCRGGPLSCALQPVEQRGGGGWSHRAGDCLGGFAVR